MTPDYRNIHKHTNLPGTPRDQLKCEYCHVLLTDKNRSVISKMVVTLDHNIYQICRKCRKKFYGKIGDSTMLKRAYLLAKIKESESLKEEIWEEEINRMEEIHPGHKHLPGLE